ncbi:HWE histidine kinase domain-containing protein [Novosphingobium tardum]|uniref:histidine kinase n=1 Tax=Novosphingobium tardum TaxID=1538021 RepID=A0ABV8RMK8_9SPHN
MSEVSSIPAVDLSSCAAEPIHIPGRIQSFGALIAVGADWMVTHRSANFGAFLGLSRQPEPGESIALTVGPELLATLRHRLSLMQGSDAIERIFGVSVTPGGPLFDIALHASGKNFVFEFERHTDVAPEHYLSLLRPMMARLEQERSPLKLCEAAARQMRTLLGFDRVMVYRFHPDDSGEVFAEARDARLESFLHLRYPASDIPPQARALYLRNLLRIISDVDDDVVPIEPVTSPSGAPLDLSQSTLRAVSPIHLEYLRNMGVDASLSISIIVDGKLWGLFACHHYSPRILPFPLRSAAELFSMLFAQMLDKRLTSEASGQADEARKLHDKLMVQLAETNGFIENFDMMVRSIADVIPFDGACAFIEGHYVCRGSSPTEEQFRDIIPLLNRNTASTVFATESLGRISASAARFADQAAGMLAIPVSRRPRDYIILWRRELVQTVHWAGNPEKAVEYGPNGARLTPRKSFEEWQEVVRGTSAPWTDAERNAAESLRITLLEVILRIADVNVAERARAQEQQELLIAELNHRVRNILNLIRGLVSQSRHEAIDIASFTDLIGGRINALASAHDNLTRRQWAPSSLVELIEVEARAYLAGKADRVSITGTDAMIAPEAYTVLALVLHEMMTNGAKYGSLCDRHGRVHIRLEREDDGSLRLSWRETGGPPVKPPQRRGFGSTIIERSIPYELKGSAQIRYLLSGIEADFVIPGRFVSEDRTAPPASDQAPSRGPNTGDDVVIDKKTSDAPPQSILLVEDNMIIAIDTEEMLLAMGVAEVSMASSVDAALAIVANNPPAFAVLDYNLGGENSEPIARALHERGIPFVFATGYGEVSGISDQFGENARIMQKPYSKDDLAAAIGLG